MNYWPMPKYLIRPDDRHHLTLTLCPEGHYETADGVHRIHYRPGAGWSVDNGAQTYPFPENAARALHHRLTRYTWHATPGEQCAICGEPRPYGGVDLTWWWHTICRARTDPAGAEEVAKYMDGRQAERENLGGI